MRLIRFSLIVFFGMLFYSCNSQSSGFGENFIRSLKESKFDLLKEHFPTIEFYKSIPELAKLSDTEIKNFLKQSNERLKENWQKIADRLKTEKTDISKVELVESVIYDPFEKENEMLAMVLVYKYNAKTWDDLSFIVSQWKDKTFLLEIPNPTRAFTFYDETLRASTEAKASLDFKKPEFKKTLEEQVKRIITKAKENNPDAFITELVYRGDDENRKWKSVMNENDPDEKQQADQFMKRVAKLILPCENYEVGDLRSDRESEGLWIVLEMNCGEKIISFAFLKIGGRFLLGDIDSESKQ